MLKEALAKIQQLFSVLDITITINITVTMMMVLK
jgi:hypothetical protein